MTDLTSPAAEPAAPPNAMPDIIDSLKRLERIGSESSKTVEKIIGAARDIEGKIVAQYKHSKGTRIQGNTFLLHIAHEKGCSLIEAATSLGLNHSQIQSMRYKVEWREGEGWGVFFGDGPFRVSDGREHALAFARDLANGLLVLIEADLLARQAEDKQALNILETAIVPTPKLPDEF
jgi:hypothetical protein